MVGSRIPPNKNKPDLIRQIEGRLNKTKKRPKLSFLNTGSTMLNLAISDNINGGWPLGRMCTLPGQSAAGKTILVLSTFAEAAIDSRFDGYELIYDDIERRCDFDFQRLFKPIVSRLVTPGGTLYKDLKSENHDVSNTIQDLKNYLLLLKKKEKSFIYIADSLDSLSTDEELEKEMRRAIQMAKTDEAVKVIKGSYNAEKPKILGQALRMIKGVVADTNSVFILTQQLRQRFNPMPGQNKFVTSGGEAPYFYSHVRPWLYKAESIRKNKIKVGVSSRVTMEKNSVTGKLRDVSFDIYYSIGIDDIGSMVKFLIDIGHWKSGSWIKTKEFSNKHNGKEALIKYIRVNKLTKDLKRIAQEAWDKREKSLDIDVEPRYE